MKPLLSAFIVLISLLSAPVHAQGVRTGIEAYERGDYATALREWRALAERGDGEAQGSLGLLYVLGHGVLQDFDEAIKWFRLSAEQGYAIGQNNLAVMYQNGHGVPRDYEAAVKLFRLAAAQGYTVAQFSLGTMFENGFGVERDDEEAYMWYTLAAEKGHNRARQAQLALEPELSTDQKSAALARARKHQAREAAAPARNPFGPADTPAPPKAVADARPADASPPPPTKGAAEPPANADGARWRIQLASVTERAEAEAEWKRLQQANQDLLNGLTLHVVQAKLSRGTFYRVQAGPLADRAAAVSLCGSLKSRNQDCLVVVP